MKSKENPEIPIGLQFFNSNSSEKVRRRTKILVIALIVTAFAITWPVFAFVADTKPYILGLPFSFAWIVGWLFVIFTTLVILYRAEFSSSNK